MCGQEMTVKRALPGDAIGLLDGPAPSNCTAANQSLYVKKYSAMTKSMPQAVSRYDMQLQDRQ
jgi:hypothetical protein